MGAQVFISYSSKDGKSARAICYALESRGLSCWISSRDVGPDENFMDAIVNAIGAAQVMVLVFSENANNSEDVKREIVLASSGKVTIIPVRVEDVVPKGAFAYQFATRQWIDLFEDWEAQIERLAKWIAGTTSATSNAQASAEPAGLDSPAVVSDRRPREEAQRRADEEAQRKTDEAEAQRIAEEKRRQQEAERADEEERRKRAEKAETRQRAEEERLGREAEAKQRADQQQAFAAAKLADTVSAVDEARSRIFRGLRWSRRRVLRQAGLRSCDRGLQ